MHGMTGQDGNNSDIMQNTGATTLFVDVDATGDDNDDGCDDNDNDNNNNM